MPPGWLPGEYAKKGIWGRAGTEAARCWQLRFVIARRVAGGSSQRKGTIRARPRKAKASNIHGWKLIVQLQRKMLTLPRMVIITTPMITHTARCTAQSATETFH